MPAGYVDRLEHHVCNLQAVLRILPVAGKVQLPDLVHLEVAAHMPILVGAQVREGALVRAASVQLQSGSCLVLFPGILQQLRACEQGCASQLHLYALNLSK